MGSLDLPDIVSLALESICSLLILFCLVATRERHNKLRGQSKLEANASTNKVQSVHWESDRFVKHILCLLNPDFCESAILSYYSHILTAHIFNKVATRRTLNGFRQPQVPNQIGFVIFHAIRTDIGDIGSHSGCMVCIGGG
jgi:hypothetical protein